MNLLLFWQVTYLVSQIKMIVQIRAVRVCGHVVGCPGLMIGQQPVCPIGSRKPLKYFSNFDFGRPRKKGYLKIWSVGKG